MLQRSIQKKNQLWAQQDVALSPKEALRRDYENAEEAISGLVSVVGWNQIPVTQEAAQDEILTAYVAVLEAFFQVAARQTWSHLVVMSPASQEKLVAKKPAQSKNQQVLALRQFLLKSYFERQQSAFTHSWHLVLKWGLVDLALEDQEIENHFLIS